MNYELDTAGAFIALFLLFAQAVWICVLQWRLDDARESLRTAYTDLQNAFQAIEQRDAMLRQAYMAMEHAET